MIMKNTKKASLFLMTFVKLTGFIPAFLFFKPKVYLESDKAKRKLPKKAILMSNHTSLLDFVLYLIVFWKRNIHFLMAEVLFNKGKLFAWFLHKIGGIFVNRDACNFSFVEESLELLERNKIVGVFPQGRLPVNGKPFPFKPGIVLIALRTNAPIVPVYTDGNYGITKRTRIIIGEEIHLQDYAESADVSSDELMRLTKMLEEKTEALKTCLAQKTGAAHE